MYLLCSQYTNILEIDQEIIFFSYSLPSADTRNAVAT